MKNRTINVLIIIAIVINFVSCGYINKVSIQENSIVNTTITNNVMEIPTADKKVEVNKMEIKITVGDNTLNAILNDNESSKKFYDMLPLTLNMMNLYEREMCYRFGNGTLPDADAKNVGYEIGDISYWPPAGSLVILYKQNDEIFEQVKIGKVLDDVSFFDGTEDTVISFEKKQ